MSTREMTIDEALKALVDGSITDAQVIAGETGVPRSSWAGYELPHGGPEAEMLAYWRVLRAWPKSDPVPEYRPAFASVREQDAFYAGQEKALED